MKIRLSLLLVIIFIFSMPVLVQAADAAPVIDWSKCLGGSSTDQINSIQQTNDGGYILAGYSNSTNGDVTGNYGSSDYWVVKLDSNRGISWSRCLGGSGEDIAFSIQQTSDGGYIVAGQTTSTNGDVTGNHGGFYDCWVVKLDSRGEISWSKCLGGNRSDIAQSIQQTSDGGYIVAGYSNSKDGDVTGKHGSYDCWVVKLDSKGEISWNKCLGGNYIDTAQSIQQTSDGGYIVAGYSNSTNGDVTGNHGSYDCWVVKLDSGGGISWSKCLGGSYSEIAQSIQQTSDGGYIVAGRTTSTNGDVIGNHGGHDYWVVKLDSRGGISWSRCLGGKYTDIAQSIQQTNDGGYIVAGYSYSTDGDVTGNHGGYDYWVVKMDSRGEIEWQKCFGGSDYDNATTIRQTSDGGYVLAGYSSSTNGDVTGNRGEDDCWIVKLKSATVLVNGIILDPAKVTLEKGDRITVEATVLPSDANQNVTWTSSDALVATVDENGTVRAINNGTVVIIATTEDGRYSASCIVTVRTPIDNIDNILVVFDKAVEAGTLSGNGSDAKLKAFRNMLEQAELKIGKDKIKATVNKLYAVYAFIDGKPAPKDMVVGTAANKIALKILHLIKSLESQS